MKTPDSIQTILDTASSSRRHVAGLRGDFRSRLNSFRRHRSASDQQELTDDFRRVLAAWGIADDDAIPRVIRVLRLRLVIFAVPALACLFVAAWRQSPAASLALACVAPPCLLGMATTLWRISILQNRRFLPLSRWLRHVAGFPRKRP